MSDKELFKTVEQAIRGEEGAFARLCEVKGRDILYISIRLMGNVQDGEDAAQEILMYMQEHICDLKHPEAFKVWLYRMIRGTCAYMKRKNDKNWISSEKYNVDRKEERKEFLPYEYIEDENKREILFSIIDELDYKCRMSTYMYYFENMNYVEIAAVLNIKKKDVDNALMKSRKLIRKKMKHRLKVKDYLPRSFTITALPVLARAFHEDVQAIVPEQSYVKLVERFQTPTVGGAAATAVGKYLQEIIPNTELPLKGSAGISTGTKVVVGFAVTSGVVAGAVAYINRERPEVQNSSSDVIQDSVFSHTSPSEDITEEEDFDIKTLEDMIGTEAAEQLIDFVNSEGVTKEELHAFLEETGMELEQSEWMVKADIEDTLYKLIKQKKLLMVITRLEKTKNIYGIVYRFTDIDEDLPRGIEIPLSYEEWKEEH